MREILVTIPEHQDKYRVAKKSKKTGKPKPKKPSNIDTKFSVDKEVLSSMSSIPKEWRYVHIAFIRRIN